MSFHHSHHNINSWYVIFHMTFCSHFSIFADQSERRMCDHWPMRGLILTSGLTGWCDIGPGPPVTEPSVVTQSVCGARAAACWAWLSLVTARSYKCQCLESCCCQRGLAWRGLLHWASAWTWRGLTLSLQPPHTTDTRRDHKILQ